jgi:hypothetical protein
MLMKSGLNYFISFRDVDKKHPAGLAYGFTEWAGLFPHMYGDLGGCDEKENQKLQKSKSLT